VIAPVGATLRDLSLPLLDDLPLLAAISLHEPEVRAVGVLPCRAEAAFQG